MSRLLKRAAESGIVRTVVVVSQGVHTDIEEALEQKYGLLEAVVVDVDGDDQDIITGLGSAGRPISRAPSPAVTGSASRRGARPSSPPSIGCGRSGRRGRTW